MEYIAQFLAEAVVEAAAEPASSDGGAWTESDQSRLIRLAVTGTQTGKFHADGVFPPKWRDGDAFRPAPGREGRPPLALDSAIRLLLRAPAGALAEAALRGRREGSVPAAPVLALVFLSFRDAALFRETFPRVVLDGADLRLYLDLSRCVGALNRVAKAALRDWLRGHATLREAQRHRAALADAIRLSHFRGEDPLYAWILAAHRGVKGVTPEKVAAAEAAYPALAARREFIRAVEAGLEKTPCRLLDTPDLDVDALSNWERFYTPAIWRAVSRRMSPRRLLDYLPKLHREHALDAEIVAQRAQAGDFRGEIASLLRIGADWKFLHVGVEKGRYDPDAAACEDAKETLSSATDESIRAIDWRAFHRFSWHVTDLCGCRMPLNRLFSVGLTPSTSPDEDCGEEHQPETPAEAVEELIRRGADADCVLFLVDGAAPRYRWVGGMHAGMWIRRFDDCRDPAWEPAWKRYRRLHPTARAFFLDVSDLGPDPVAAALSTLRLALESPIVPDDGVAPLSAPLPPPSRASTSDEDTHLSRCRRQWASRMRHEPLHLSREDWRLLLRRNPRWILRYPYFYDNWRRLKHSFWNVHPLLPDDWVELFRLHPEMKTLLDGKTPDPESAFAVLRDVPALAPASFCRDLSGPQWAELLRDRPELADLCDWGKLSPKDMKQILLQIPAPAAEMIHLPFLFTSVLGQFPRSLKSNSLDEQVELIRRCPALAGKCDWSRIGGSLLATLLAERPGLAVWADLSLLPGPGKALPRRHRGNKAPYRHSAQKRRKRPAPVVPADTPSEAVPDTGAGWVDWLRAHPEDAAACEWGKLGAEDWIRLLSSNPEWAWRPEWRRLVPEGEWKAFLRERRRDEAFRPAPRAIKPGRWIRPRVA